jgi:hypothetical protein
MRNPHQVNECVRASDPVPVGVPAQRIPRVTSVPAAALASDPFRTNARTLWPRRRSSAARRLPINPLAPVMNTIAIH